MINYINKNKKLSIELFNAGEKAEEAYKNYFVKNNFLNYIDEFDNINEKQEKALEILFSGEGEILDRCQKALDINNTCFEAYFLLNYLSDSLSFYYQTLDIQNTPIENYEDEYEINDVVNIRLAITYYYLDICNYHQALKHLNDVKKIIDIKEILTTFIIVYNYLEDYQSIKNLYENNSFDAPEQYIMFIISILKNDKNEYAKEIYEDMASKFKYASYICKPQELSLIKDDEANSMMRAVEMCFDYIESVPNFFSWASECIDAKNAPIN